VFATRYAALRLNYGFHTVYSAEFRGNYAYDGFDFVFSVPHAEKRKPRKGLRGF